jgi:hypothetical protein
VKARQNPLSDMMFITFQNNMSYGIGEEGKEGTRFTTNFQPLIPNTIKGDWYYVHRPIIPIISQTNIGGVADTQNGIGDTVYSGFVGKRKKNFNFGLGPAVSIPSWVQGISSKKWGAGPAAILHAQEKNWVVGFISYQIWSFAGDQDRTNVDQLFFQPFLVYTIPTGYAFGVIMDDYYNWITDKWIWSANPFVQKVFKWNGQATSIAVGPRFFDGPENVTPDIGFRITLNFMFVK